MSTNDIELQLHVKALEKRVAELERVVKYLAQFSGNPEINQYEPS